MAHMGTHSVPCPRCEDRLDEDGDCVLCDRLRRIDPELAAAYLLRFGSKRPKWYSVDQLRLEYNRGAIKK